MMAVVTSAPVLLLWSVLRAPAVIAAPVLVGAFLLGACGGWWLDRVYANRQMRGRPATSASTGDLFVMQMLAEAAGLVGELGSLVSQLTHQVGELAQAECVAFVLRRPDGESGWAVAGEAAGLSGDDLDWLEQWANEHAELIEQLDSPLIAAPPEGDPSVLLPNERNLVLLPLRVNETAVGLVRLSNRAAAGFSPADVEMLVVVADHLAPILAASCENQGARSQLAETALLCDLGTPLVGELDFDQAVERTLQVIQTTLEYEQVAVFLVDESSEALTLQGTALQQASHFEGVVPLGEGVVGRVAASGQAEVVVDEQAGPALLPGRRAELGVPLKLGSWVIGVLDAQSVRPEAFGEADLRVLGQIADQVAQVLHRARLYQAMRQRVAELSLLYEATVAISAAEMDLAGIIALVMKRLIRATGVDGGRLALWDREHRRLITRFANGAALPEPAETYLRNHLLSSHKVLPLYPDDPKLDRAVAQAMRHDGIGSALFLPLVARNRVIGLVELVSKQRRRRFSAEEIQLTLTLGTQAAIALENAQLYQDARQAVDELTALQALALDITAQVTLPELLDRLMTRARHLLQATGSSIHLLGHESEQLELAADEWTNEKPELALIDEALAQARQAVRQDQAFHLQVRELGRRNGPVVQCAHVPLCWRDQVMGVLSVYRSGPRSVPFVAAELKLLEMLAPQAAVAVRNVQLYEELDLGLHELEQAQTSLIQVEKAAALGRLTAALAHEINNPLQALNNCLHLALRSDLEEAKKASYLRMAQNEVERLMGIVDRMLNFYRPAGDEGRTEVQVNQLLGDVLALLTPQLEHNGIASELELAPDLPPIRAVDSSMRQVFVNLILNAAEAMPEGGRVSIKTALLAPGLIGVTIADSGQGIPPADLNRIYEPFFTTKKTGTGLGLAIAQGIIQEHAGKIDVESEIGRGSTFVLRLPIGGARFGPAGQQVAR